MMILFECRVRVNLISEPIPRSEKAAAERAAVEQAAAEQDAAAAAQEYEEAKRHMSPEEAAVTALRDAGLISLRKK